MTEEKYAITVLEKRMSARAAAVEICQVEGERTGSKITAIEWLFRRISNGETSLQDQPR